MDKVRNKFTVVAALLRATGILMLLLRTFGLEARWLIYCGLALIGISCSNLFWSSELKHESHSIKLFCIYALLMTVGVVLILINISWLTFLGLGVVLLSSFYSSRWPASSRALWPFVVCLLGAILQLSQDVYRGDIFNRKPVPMWLFIILTAMWLFGISMEYFSRCRAGSKINESVPSIDTKPK